MKCSDRVEDAAESVDDCGDLSEVEEVAAVRVARVEVCLNERYGRNVLTGALVLNGWWVTSSRTIR